LDNNIRIGFVVFKKIRFGDRGVYSQIKLTYIDNKYKGNNLAVKMYKEIRNRENVRIMSASVQTEDSKKLWKKLSEEMPVYGINTNGDILPVNQIEDLYTSNNWVLITENRSIFFTLCGSKEFCEGDILIPYTKI